MPVGIGLLHPQISLCGKLHIPSSFFHESKSGKSGKKSDNIQMTLIPRLVLPRFHIATARISRTMTMSTLRTSSRYLLSSRCSSLHPVQYATPAMRRRKPAIMLRPFSEKSWRHPVFPTSDSGHVSEVPTDEILAKFSPSINTLESQTLHEQKFARKRQWEKTQKHKSQRDNDVTVIQTFAVDGGGGYGPTEKKETHDGDKDIKAQDINTDPSIRGVDGEKSHGWNGADADYGGDGGGSGFNGDIGGLFGDGGA